MGYTMHHTIVVTCWRREEVEKAHAFAVGLGMQVSAPVEGAINGDFSFFVAPDGSKEGWTDSDLGDLRRTEFKAWLRSGGLYCDWVEVAFGGDYNDAMIVDHGDMESAPHHRHDGGGG